ncbi:MAG: polyhydroxyalkanoate synthesis regulator DNA-binding domain-containing protein [Labilithrix sp.]|nr:polyhydroxyalkanoate synthesis regulator DNA-binding domain-containing protein [Labilithrix sp.]MBX3224032.1 polyhydroxyalkanoate synthesis regulator DNA-binding domain-containing protein [Labilithrix sp.]
MGRCGIPRSNLLKNQRICHERKVSVRFRRRFSTLRVGVSWIPGAPVENKAQENVTDDRPRRVIKRYSNRKLYDTKDSRYVTLLQIAEMVRGGEEVQIIDNNTKEDLTEVTLAQIIYEEQKQKASSSRNVPLQTLKDLIHQRTEKVLSDLREGPIGRLIPGAAKSEPPSKTSLTETPVPPKAEEKDNGAPPAPPSSPGKPSLVEQAKETWEDWQTKIDERVKAVVPNLLPWQQLQHEIKRLNTRIEELEEKLKSMGGKDGP